VQNLLPLPAVKLADAIADMHVANTCFANYWQFFLEILQQRCGLTFDNKQQHHSGVMCLLLHLE